MKEIEIPLLETQAITMRFGGVTAVNSLTEVYPGEIA